MFLIVTGLIFTLVVILVILYFTGVFNTPTTPPTTDTTPPAPSETTESTVPAVPELAKCYQGNVTIDWGHTDGAAGWACDNWKSTCGNNGGCTATGPGTVIDGKSTWACNLKTNCST